MDEFEELFGEKKPEKKVAGPEGHRARVRDAMERNPELSGFDDYELLEYLLFVTNPRKDTKPLACPLANGDFRCIARPPAIDNNRTVCS